MLAHIAFQTQTPRPEVVPEGLSPVAILEVALVTAARSGLVTRRLTRLGPTNPGRRGTTCGMAAAGWILQLGGCRLEVVATHRRAI